MNHKEQPITHAADYFRGLVYWMDRRPESLNDGLTIEQIMNEYNQERNAP